VVVGGVDRLSLRVARRRFRRASEARGRVRAERSVRPAGVEEMDRRGRETAELDLAGDLLDELVALLVRGIAHAAPDPAATEPSEAPSSPAASFTVAASIASWKAR